MDADEIDLLIQNNELLNLATLIGQQQEEILSAIAEFKPDLEMSVLLEPEVPRKDNVKHT